MGLRQVVLLLLLSLVTGCASARVVRLDTGEGRPLEYTPPSTASSVQVGEDAFEEALARLVLGVPLSLRPSQAGGLVRASTHGATMDSVMQGTLRKGYGRWCRAHEGPGDCLSLLEDGLGFSQNDRLALAVGLSMDAMHESIAEAVEDTLNPHFFKAVVVSALVSWAVLAANPEPVFTKGAAVLSAVLLAYLGVDAFLAVVRACFELKEATDRATTFQELETAGVRFGRVLGKEGARVFVLAVTALVSHGTVAGGSALVARLSLLPRFTEAAALGAVQVGVRLEAVAEVMSVAVVDGSLALVLGPNAVAMAALSGGDRSAQPSVNVGGGRGFHSFDAFKSAMGPAGPGKNWHHIVEQTPGNVSRFGPYALHNTSNMIALDVAIHRQISGLYSSIRAYSRGMTVRKWLSTQPFEAQHAFGLRILRDFGVIP